MNRDEIQANLIKASHMISMDDIIREGYPTLREVANDVTLPLSDEDIILGEKMLQFLHNSQDPVMAEKWDSVVELDLQQTNLACSKKSLPF